MVRGRVEGRKGGVDSEGKGREGKEVWSNLGKSFSGSGHNTFNFHTIDNLQK